MQVSWDIHVKVEHEWAQMELRSNRAWSGIVRSDDFTQFIFFFSVLILLTVSCYLNITIRFMFILLCNGSSDINFLLIVIQSEWNGLSKQKINKCRLGTWFYSLVVDWMRLWSIGCNGRPKWLKSSMHHQKIELFEHRNVFFAKLISL